VIEGEDNNLWVCNVTFGLNKQLSACFVFNRLGTMPSHYGVTSLAISRENQVLRDECAKIGEALNYSGPAMIEFKKDRNSGNYYYIETNPRLGMCNWFDTRCGINNILACTQVAYGNTVAFAPQKNNRVYWNFFGDLVARIEDRENVFAVLIRYIRLLRYRRVAALLYWKDPHPAFRYSCMSIRDIWSRVMRRLRGETN
jgi:predicted ATP-grasp superfamily ATP-dependent carboligase